MRHTHNNYLSTCPTGAGYLLAGNPAPPACTLDSMRMTQPSVGKRKRLALFRTINCREQLISAHGRLERVLKRAKRFRLMARHISRKRFAPTIPDRHAHRPFDVQCLQRCWNSQLIIKGWLTLRPGLETPVNPPVLPRYAPDLILHDLVQVFQVRYWIVTGKVLERR